MLYDGHVRIDRLKSLCKHVDDVALPSAVRAGYENGKRPLRVLIQIDVYFIVSVGLLVDDDRLAAGHAERADQRQKPDNYLFHPYLRLGTVARFDFHL